MSPRSRKVSNQMRLGKSGTRLSSTDQAISIGSSRWRLGWEDIAIYVAMLVILLLSNYPYLLGLWLTHSGSTFSGIFFNDIFSYIAKMRDGYEGSWHYTNRYTTEPSQPSLLFMFYIFLGHLARWSGISLVAMYHVSRIVSAILLMLSIRRLLRCTEITGWGAIFGFIFCFSICSLPFPIPEFFDVERYMVSEGHEFLTIAYFPHIAASTALLVFILTDFLLLSRNQAQIGAILRIAAAAFCVTWIHPRLLLTAGLVGWIMASIIIMQEKRIPWRLALGGIAFALPGALISRAIVSSYSGDPLLEFWATIETLSPHIIVLLFNYGPLLPLAMFGAWLFWKANRSGSLLLILWAVITLALCYYPSSHQRRMFQGFDIPIALLAGYFLDRCLVFLRESGSLRIRKQRWIWAFLAFLAICNFNLIPQIREIYGPILKGWYPWWMRDSQLAGLNWLNSNSPRSSIVLSSSGTGMAIPGLAGNRVYVGHWAETFRKLEKQDEFEKFRDASTPTEWRRTFIIKNDIRYLFWSPLEVSPSKGPENVIIYDPSSEPDIWRIVFAYPSIELPEVVIFQSNLPGNPSGISHALPPEGDQDL